MQYGLYSSDLFNSRVDIHFAGYRYMPPTGPSYGSWSFSAGRMIGDKLYLSGEYSSSLAILRQTEENGVIVENQPHSSRYNVSAIANLSRAISLQFSLDHITGDLDDETQFMAGISYRFY
jgi:hypothetical protein